jgi:hypothetical protein
VAFGIGQLPLDGVTDLIGPDQGPASRVRSRAASIAHRPPLPGLEGGGADWIAVKRNRIEPEYDSLQSQLPLPARDGSRGHRDHLSRRSDSAKKGGEAGRGHVGDGIDRPLGGDPFARGAGQDAAEVGDPGG